MGLVTIVSGAIARQVMQYALDASKNKTFNTEQTQQSLIAQKFAFWDYVGLGLVVLFVSIFVLGMLTFVVCYALYCFGWFR
jgi:hypothetical protein